MRTTQDQENLQSKQRLRNEINTHVEAFLHNGGRIEVLKELPDYTRGKPISPWPAATDTLSLSGDY